MTWLFGLILALLCVLAVAFVVLPLLAPAGGYAHRPPEADESNVAIYRRRLRELEADLESGAIDREAFDEARRELDRELVGELSPAGRERPAGARRPHGGLAVATIGMPVLAVGVYLWLGAPEALTPSVVADAEPTERTEMVSMIRERIGELEQRAEDNPEDVVAWRMLGQAYLVLERPTDAAEAFGRAIDAGGASAELLTSRARALAAAADGRFTGEPRRLLQRALTLDGAHSQALWFGGLAALQAGDAAQARTLWETLLTQLPPDSEVAAQLRSAIGDLPGGDRPGAGGDGAGTRVEVAVRLAPDLAGTYPPDTTVFVLARAVDGPGMPLAVRRMRLDQLPTTVALDDSLAMTPELRLSRFDRVEVVARVSASGETTAQPGDLEGRAGPVAVGGRGAVDVVVDERL